MSWVLLKSTVLRAVRYSSQQQRLDLEFRTRAIYRYSPFPANQYDDLLAADSHGQYFNHHILNRFPVEQLRPPHRKRA
jgi:KTSC domain-containing protein